MVKTVSGAKIKPNENLLFDIEVMDVISTAQYEAKQMEAKKGNGNAAKNAGTNATTTATTATTTAPA